MYQNYIPPAALDALQDETKPERKRKDPYLTEDEKERYGVKEQPFDEESASYMDKQGPIVAERRTNYSEDQLGCGSKFTSEGNDTNNHCER